MNDVLAICVLVNDMPAENPYEKTILCLANSYRPDGFCVAGKEFDDNLTGAWVRPINSGNSNAISARDREYEDGAQADLLDIIRIPMLRSAARGHHHEDHEIDSDLYWTKAGRATWQQVVNATDNVQGTLWHNGDSSRHGMNDKVREELARQQTRSLLLIEPTRLDLVVGPESMFGGGTQRRVRASFQHNGNPYNFVVTDPWIRDKYLARNDGTFRIQNSRLCVSLPEVLNGNSTKLVAAVITSDRV
jgi:hypothetical protein